MLSGGNGEVSVCVRNLLRTLKGEVRNDCLRGLPSDLIDSPAPSAKAALEASGKWLLETYEPRVTAEEVSIDLDFGSL